MLTFPYQRIFYNSISCGKVIFPYLKILLSYNKIRQSNQSAIAFHSLRVGRQRERIKEAFSDEVKVEPKDKTSGFIIPIFKKDKEQKYLYILVPISYEQ